MQRPDPTGTGETGRTLAGAWSSAPGQPITGLPDFRTPGVTESQATDQPAAHAAGGPRPQQTEADRMHTSTDRHPAATAAPADGGVRAPGSRPSPRPRPAPPAPPVAAGPVPDDVPPVTHGNSPQVSTGESKGAPASPLVQEDSEKVSSLQSSLHFNLDTLREQIRSGLGGIKGYWTPPSVLTETPASVAELAAYAHWGAWTSSTDGPLRKLGIVWHRAFSLPATVVCRYVEWLWQRPGRLIPVYVLWKLLISTGPGPWVADHLIHPVLGVIAWVLL
jgi:hypothetical protein